MLFPEPVWTGVLGCCWIAALLAALGGGDTGAAGCTRTFRGEDIGNDSGTGPRVDASRPGASYSYRVGVMPPRPSDVAQYEGPPGRVPRGRKC